MAADGDVVVTGGALKLWSCFDDSEAELAL